MTSDPQNSEHEFTPEEIKKLAKFFGLLWETQKELKERNENQEGRQLS